MTGDNLMADQSDVENALPVSISFRRALPKRLGGVECGWASLSSLPGMAELDSPELRPHGWYH